MAAPILGMAVGIGLALVVTRLLSGFLLGLSPLDPVTYLAVAVILGSVALAAVFAPARRAARLDPMITLRGE